MLEPTTGGEERHPLFAREPNRTQCALHVSVRASGGDEEPGITGQARCRVCADLVGPAPVEWKRQRDASEGLVGGHVRRIRWIPVPDDANPSF